MVKVKPRIQVSKEEETLGFVNVPFPKGTGLLYKDAHIVKQNIASYKILDEGEINKILETQKIFSKKEN